MRLVSRQVNKPLFALALCKVANCLFLLKIHMERGLTSQLFSLLLLLSSSLPSPPPPFYLGPQSCGCFIQTSVGKSMHVCARARTHTLTQTHTHKHNYTPCQEGHRPSETHLYAKAFKNWLGYLNMLATQCFLQPSIPALLIPLPQYLRS